MRAEAKKSSTRYRCDLEVSLCRPEEPKSYISFDTEFIHTIEWDDAISADLSRLPRWLTDWATEPPLPPLPLLGANGKCVLTTFPRISFQNSGEIRLATPEELCVLVAILLDLACMKLPSNAVQ
jgi:hypothetical protein